MLIHNITFLIDPARTEEFLRWMRAEGAPILRRGGNRELSLSLLKEVEGAPNPPDRGVSVAARSVFDAEEEFRRWERKELEEALASYRSVFGAEALAFCTMLESMDFIIGE